MLKRLFCGAALAAVLALGPAVTAGAAEGPEVLVEDIKFTILSDNCDELSDGSTIDGTGTRVNALFERDRRDGVTVFRNTSVGVGTATDQAGNAYTWLYEARFRASNTLDDPTTFRGVYVDEFTLSGDGPERLHNGFVADITFVGSPAAGFTFVPRHTFGDPVSFDPITNRCDPI